MGSGRSSLGRYSFKYVYQLPLKASSATQDANALDQHKKIRVGFEYRRGGDPCMDSTLTFRLPPEPVRLGLFLSIVRHLFFLALYCYPTP